MDRALGFDVSHWRPVVDWRKVPSLYRFVGIKATEGAGNVDPTLSRHRDAARALPPGTFDLVVYYHVARPGDGAAQAARFLAALGELQPNERLALDTERTSAVDVEYMAAFLGALPTDRRPLLYTSNGVWLGPFMGNPAFPEAARTDLWLPRYGSASEPVVPDPWHQIGKSWTIWQSTDSGNVPGVGACDVNMFNGTADQLRIYASLPPLVA